MFSKKANCLFLITKVTWYPLTFHGSYWQRRTAPFTKPKPKRVFAAYSIRRGRGGGADLGCLWFTSPPSRITFLRHSNTVTADQTLNDSAQRVHDTFLVSSYSRLKTCSTVAKRGSVFIGLMTSDGTIWFRYQRAVLMRWLSYLCRRS